jgi:AraC-like DNA-binding protein
MEELLEHARWFHAIVSDAQVIVGVVPDAEPQEIYEMFIDFGRRLSRPVNAADQILLDRLLRRILGAITPLGETKPLRPDDATNLLTASGFLSRLQEQRTTNPLSKQPHWRIAIFHRVLEESYANPQLRTGHIAQKLNISVSYLSRLLKAHTGRGFRWHLRAYRTRAAARLLTTATLAIKEISANSGYLSVSEFDRHFRSAYGMSPSQYRDLLTRNHDCSADGLRRDLIRSQSKGNR